MWSLFSRRRRPCSTTYMLTPRRFTSDGTWHSSRHVGAIWARGAAALNASRHELLELGLKNDYALATLDWAEVRLELGQPEGLADACRGIIMQFEAEGMRQKAAVALDYVKRALAAEHATPALIRDVRQYLARLPRRPDVLLVPAA